MRYKKLLSEIKAAFQRFNPPENIYSESGSFSEVSSASQRIQKEFHGKKREDLTTEECAILIFENGTISDKAYYYFLPRLAQAVFTEGADEFLFYSHIEKMSFSLLDDNQKKVINKLIKALKEIERALETEEEKELKKFNSDLD